MAAMGRLNGIWRSNTISFASKFKLYKSLITSIFLYGCETRSLLADSEIRIQAFETKCLRKLLRNLLLGTQDQRLGAEQDQLPCGPTGTSSGTCEETETRMVLACCRPRQPHQNHPSLHVGGRTTRWSVEEMLDRQRKRVDTRVHARIALNSLPQKSLEEDLC